MKKYMIMTVKGKITATICSTDQENRNNKVLEVLSQKSREIHPFNLPKLMKVLYT